MQKLLVYVVANVLSQSCFSGSLAHKGTEITLGLLCGGRAEDYCQLPTDLKLNKDQNKRQAFFLKPFSF